VLQKVILMRKYIVIDYINLAIVFHLVRKNRGSNVVALFQPTSKLLENILTRVLSSFDIEYRLDKMKFENLSDNPYQNVLVETNKVVNKFMLLYENDKPSKTIDYFNYILRNKLFHLLWRSSSILEYIKIDNKIDEVYISIKARKEFLKRYFKFLSDQDCKIIIIFYNDIGKMNDTGYLFKRPASRKFRFLAYIFFIQVGFKKVYSKIDSLLFSHNRDTVQGWINGIEVGNFVDFTYKIVWPDKSIGKKSDNLPFRYIYWKDLYSYLLHLISGLIRFFPFYLSIGFDAYSALVRNWTDLFLLQSFYKKHRIKIIYSNFDSDFTQLALAVASDNKKIVSFSAIWSLGNYPLKGCVTFQKFADRFFIWGRWHYSLLSSSNDKSSGYVITGYIGDIYSHKMLKDAVILRKYHKKRYSNIIALYDTSVFHDLFFNNIIAENLLNTVAEVAEQSNSIIILKTKFRSGIYDKVISCYSNNIVVDCSKGSLIPALSADVVIGIENSTPVSLSALYNKRVINFNPSNTVWKYWKSTIAKDMTMVETLGGVRRELINKLKMLDKPYLNVNIDPFVDGKSQERMAQYICDVSNQLHKGKGSALAYADTNYIEKNGVDKIIYNE